ncbi:sigma-70 family RNA polymerase sigma factor [Tautonia plasticadhaerens]|uniref:RNA polymerase sigma factor SigA n=1 Tax=Tautonia plasticadhaerens TaxID=2527974 RepID=A0A518GVZ1_9BACT|nr:sigma-70 family RNA polymerase sigma factor [Tautonia plasticadhaerens]QDV32739.1 RNA polymerase sigma factor SigA [Tautonia plasticadhaerens]
MRPARQIGETDGFAGLDDAATRVLAPAEERALLRELGECKAKLARAMASVPGAAPPQGDPSDPQAMAAYISATCSGDARLETRLGAVFQQYKDLRTRLALANLRLVAHVAKRFRDRGVSYGDLMQEGFCGLIEAIDRFNLTHETKLATYATWWIRQAMQRAVASGAYPVKLSPRHLRQLAQNQEELGGRDSDDSEAPPARSPGGHGPSNEMIRRIHAATRPPVSLDATIDTDRSFTLLQTMSDPDADRTDDVDTGETITLLLDALRPREQQVLALRYGLGGAQRLSLSQVGKVLQVSKERVRQIQDRALEKLRAVAAEHNLTEALPIT